VIFPRPWLPPPLSSPTLRQDILRKSRFPPFFFRAFPRASCYHLNHLPQPWPFTSHPPSSKYSSANIFMTPLRCKQLMPTQLKFNRFTLFLSSMPKLPLEQLFPFPFYLGTLIQALVAYLFPGRNTGSPRLHRVPLNIEGFLLAETGWPRSQFTCHQEEKIYFLLSSHFFFG